MVYGCAGVNLCSFVALESFVVFGLFFAKVVDLMIVVGAKYHFMICSTTDRDMLNLFASCFIIAVFRSVMLLSTLFRSMKV